jgi:hypothetical protein
MENVVITRELSETAIRSLCRHKILAVRVEGSINASEYYSALPNLLNSSILRHVQAPNAELWWLGHSVFERSTNQNDSVATNEALRTLFQPLLSPIEHLSSLFAGCWPDGMLGLEFDGKIPGLGMFRFMRGNGESLPHQDDVRWIDQCPEELRNPEGQLAAILYLAVPQSGGELCLWDSSLTLQDYRELQGRNAFGIDWSMVSPPSVSLVPKAGEVIIFDSTRLHAVRPFTGERMTCICFMGVTARNQLVVWA